MALPGENRLAVGSRPYIPASTTEGGATARRMTRRAGAAEREWAGEGDVPEAIVTIRDREIFKIVGCPI